MGDYPDPDLEVSLIQQRERFKRSLARIDLIDIPEISRLGLGALARLQARTSTALVRREQYKRVSSIGSCLRLIPVLLVEQVLANCTDM